MPNAQCFELGSYLLERTTRRHASSRARETTICITSRIVLRLELEAAYTLSTIHRFPDLSKSASLGGGVSPSGRATPLLVPDAELSPGTTPKCSGIGPNPKARSAAFSASLEVAEVVRSPGTAPPGDS